MGEYGRGPKAVNFNIPQTTDGAENSILTLNFINFFESTKSFIHFNSNYVWFSCFLS